MQRPHHSGAKVMKSGQKKNSSPSPRNKTIELNPQEAGLLEKRLLNLQNLRKAEKAEGIFCGDFRDLVREMPGGSVNLLILDPPYNLSKEFNGTRFAKRPLADYSDWLLDVLRTLKPTLASDASIYICGDWYSSLSIYEAASRLFFVRNRICWEREKGRGAQANWKNSCEDIWFCTVSDTYTFNVEEVKLRRKVIAPYRDMSGAPKDWQDSASGAFRDTHPSNIWTDITIPFWSMPENTKHPTQKSEKLLAKLILASSKPGDLVFDPFLGSGTSAAVAKKLGRRYLGAEIEKEYCLLAEKRLQIAEEDRRIQGFTDGVFWERNTLSEQLSLPRQSKQKPQKIKQPRR